MNAKFTRDFRAARCAVLFVVRRKATKLKFFTKLLTKITVRYLSLAYKCSIIQSESMCADTVSNKFSTFVRKNVK